MYKKVILSLDYGTHGGNEEYDLDKQKEELKRKVNDLIDANPQRICLLFENEKGRGIGVNNPA